MKNELKHARLGALVAAMALAGCASTGGIDSHSSLRTPESVNLPTAAAAPSFVPAPEWWREFGDENLNRLIAQALEGNPNLRLAQSRLVRAQAAADGARAPLLPQVSGEFDVQRQRYSEHSIFPPPLGGAIVNNSTLQLNGGWELDFFGKNHAALDAALSSADAAQADVQAARVLLAANVARAWFQLARVDDQVKVAQRTLEQREEALRLVQDRVRAGLDSQLELHQSEGALPEARQQLEALREQSELVRHAIAALTGQGNRPIEGAPSLADAKAIALPAQLPADLLGQRPDIEAARRRVEAAGFEVQNAKAQFYPNVNLVAFAGFTSIGLQPLLEIGSRQWGVGPAIRLPIFEGGRLRANLRGTAADRDAAVESYNAAVLDAIHDTADQIDSLQSIARQQSEQRDAQSQAEAAYQIALQRYQAGLGTYLNVLTAETTVLNQRRLGVDLSARALDSQVALIRALGGGWRQQPASSEIAAH